MIDVHIIDAPCWRKNIASHKSILSQLNCVNTFVSEPIDGDLFEARRQAYLLGTSEFVSFVDADDFLLDASIFSQAQEYLSNNQDVSSVYSRWRVSAQNGATKFTTPVEKWAVNHHDDWSFPKVHQIVVHRRKNVEHALEELRGVKWGYLDSWILNASMMQFGRLHQLDCIAYNWVHYNKSARNYPPMKTGEDVLSLARSKLKEFKLAYQVRPPVTHK